MVYFGMLYFAPSIVARTSWTSTPVYTVVHKFKQSEAQFKQNTWAAKKQNHSATDPRSGCCPHTPPPLLTLNFFWAENARGGATLCLQWRQVQYLLIPDDTEKENTGAVMCIQSLSFIHSFARLLEISPSFASRGSLWALSVRAYIYKPSLLLICLSPVLVCIWSWRDMGLINCLLSCNWTGDGFLDCQLKSFGSADRFFSVSLSMCAWCAWRRSPLQAPFIVCRWRAQLSWWRRTGKIGLIDLTLNAESFISAVCTRGKLLFGRRCSWGCKSCGHQRFADGAYRGETFLLCRIWLLWHLLWGLNHKQSLPLWWMTTEILNMIINFIHIRK